MGRWRPRQHRPLTESAEQLISKPHISWRHPISGYTGVENQLGWNSNQLATAVKGAADNQARLKKFVNSFWSTSAGDFCEEGQGKYTKNVQNDTKSQIYRALCSTDVHRAVFWLSFWCHCQRTIFEMHFSIEYMLEGQSCQIIQISWWCDVSESPTHWAKVKHRLWWRTLSDGENLFSLRLKLDWDLILVWANPALKKKSN